MHHNPQGGADVAPSTPLELNSDFERYSYFPNLKNYFEAHSVKILGVIPFFSRLQDLSVVTSL